jgi:hypothetical protein
VHGGNDKGLTHTADNFTREAVLHYNMFHLAQEIYPDLGVIDGFEAMEGNGPVGGTPVDTRIALASLDPLAMDVLATKLMGFDPSQIMYLTSMAEAGMGQGDLSKIEVLGTPAEQCQFHFKPNERMIELRPEILIRKTFCRRLFGLVPIRHCLDHPDVVYVNYADTAGLWIIEVTDADGNLLDCSDISPLAIKSTSGIFHFCHCSVSTASGS